MVLQKRSFKKKTFQLILKNFIDERKCGAVTERKSIKNTQEI